MWRGKFEHGQHKTKSLAAVHTHDHAVESEENLLKINMKILDIPPPPHFLTAAETRH